MIMTRLVKLFKLSRKTGCGVCRGWMPSSLMHKEFMGRNNINISLMKVIKSIYLGASSWCTWQIIFIPDKNTGFFSVLNLPYSSFCLAGWILNMGAGFLSYTIVPSASSTLNIWCYAMRVNVFRLLQSRINQNPLNYLERIQIVCQLYAQRYLRYCAADALKAKCSFFRQLFVASSFMLETNNLSTQRSKKGIFLKGLRWNRKTHTS